MLGKTAKEGTLWGNLAALGGLYLLVYVLGYIHLYRRGYALSVQKIVLYVSLLDTPNNLFQIKEYTRHLAVLLNDTILVY